MIDSHLTILTCTPSPTCFERPRFCRIDLVKKTSKAGLSMSLAAIPTALIFQTTGKFMPLHWGREDVKKLVETVMSDS